jgi:3D (Asp-Asp-Asp) domain-containing protein
VTALLAALLALPAAPPPQPDPFTTWALSTVERPGLDPWKRSLLREAIATRPRYRTAEVTSYCSACSGSRTCYGERLRQGTAAADRRHWRVRPWAEHAAVIWVDRPREFGGPTLLTLTDVGGAIKGRDRFDLCAGVRDTCGCNGWGRRRVGYVVLRGER